MISGMNNYSLKTVVKFLHEKSLIQMNYNDCIACGGDSIEYIISYFETRNKMFKKDLINYNIVDCKVMKQIIELLKN